MRGRHPGGDALHDRFADRADLGFGKFAKVLKEVRRREVVAPDELVLACEVVAQRRRVGATGDRIGPVRSHARGQRQQ